MFIINFESFYLNFRCPTAKKKYSKEKQMNLLDHLDFKEQCKAGIKCVKQVHYYVSINPMSYLRDDNLLSIRTEELDLFLCSTAKDSRKYYFVIDELHRIIFSQSRYKSNIELLYYII